MGTALCVQAKGIMSDDKMTEEEIKLKIESDPDWINSRRFGFSLEKLLTRYPDGAPNRVIAAALLIQEEEIPKLYKKMIEKLRKLMNVKL